MGYSCHKIKRVEITNKLKKYELLYSMYFFYF